MGRVIGYYSTSFVLSHLQIFFDKLHLSCEGKIFSISSDQGENKERDVTCWGWTRFVNNQSNPSSFLRIYVYSDAFYHSKVVWTMSRAAADTAASALTSAGVSVRKAGRVKTALSPAVQMTARVRGPAWRASVCVTVISEERTAPSHGAPPTARAGGYALTESASARSPTPERTAWSGGV